MADLYAKCPHCSTIFHVRPDQLTAAHGQVRCGECGGLFNALHALTDQIDEDDFEEITLEGGELDTETDDDAPVEDGFPAAPEEDAVYSLEEIADDAAEDEAFGFQLLEDERGGARTRRATDSPAAEAGATGGAPPGGQDEAALEFNLPPERWAQVFGESFADEPVTRRASAEAATGVLFDADDVDESEPQFAATLDSPGRLHPRWWKIGSVALALLLVVQLLYHYRQPLLADPRTAGYMERAYRLFGADPPLILDLAEYSLTQRAGAATAGGSTLIIIASLRNEASRAQPFPLLRLILEDRWGETVGVRVFEPEEYLAGGERADRLAAGATAEARLAILDPGNTASGFDIDLCMRVGAQQLSCQE